ncbi:MAG: hypothetical protein M0014_10545 [Actinomycetota bacterium]|nr:hypothetical protein [Actinomycetota bacterium]
MAAVGAASLVFHDAFAPTPADLTSDGGTQCRRARQLVLAAEM